MWKYSILQSNKKRVVSIGALISPESGIQTFRDSDCLWKVHNVIQVAFNKYFKWKHELVSDFYNQHRKQFL